jgi:hypothetical protein
MSLLRPEHPQ